jgi:hypothetical protein
MGLGALPISQSACDFQLTASQRAIFSWLMRLLSTMKKYLLLYVAIIRLENIYHYQLSNLLSFQAVTSMRAIKCFNIYESWLFQNKGLTQNAVHNKL